MTGLQLGLDLVLHRLVSKQIIALAGQQSAHGNLIILIRLDAELASMMTIRDESFVKLLNRERKGEVFRMAVPDVAHKAMKYSI